MVKKTNQKELNPPDSSMQWMPDTLTEGFDAPKRHYEGDGGWDLTVSRNVSVAPKTFAQIPTNIRMALPKGTWAMIVGRSSTFQRLNLIVNPSIIDNGWRGPLFGVVYNPTEKLVHVRKGDRVVQLVPFNLINMEVVRVKELREGERGDKGFGSTGGTNAPTE
jgi:dUTP pyrophosphatase